MRPSRWFGIVAGLAFALGSLEGGSSGKPAQTERIARLVKQLGDEDFARREAASKELATIGEPALPALREAAASDANLEVRQRAQKIVRDVDALALAALAKKEFESLQGTWHSVVTVAGGVPQTGLNKADKHIIKGDRWVGQFNGDIAQAATLRIVGIKGKTTQIDFVITEGFKKGDVWLGIYERNGDELKWCGGYAGDGAQRPSSFATKPGDGYSFRALKREKK